jgi:hypothetical protein
MPPADPPRQMNRIPIATAASLSAIALFCGSCTPMGNSAFLTSTTSAANNHIMLVRQNPPTFGLQRLSALSTRHPDLGVFIARNGMPDFLAETSKGDNRYMILYYLSVRNAFACRTGWGASREVEFSGPYPVTQSELRTLSKLSQPAGS